MRFLSDAMIIDFVEEALYNLRSAEETVEIGSFKQL
jgi:hypothetical protein